MTLREPTDEEVIEIASHPMVDLGRDAGDGHRMVGDRVLESAHDRKRGWQGRG
jgi:hypothetical protein